MVSGYPVLTVVKILGLISKRKAKKEIHGKY
ncbi:hypothetical protein E2C01_066034 [Portunus trituberculatus]|uniref:Uncharacterized protein n=1 Tax=Portunus trituberculatus TaxID=210409 RepID=A0A5B7HST1_PORTR|nr:hypothetical protein [Portunus trituberculatus]